MSFDFYVGLFSRLGVFGFFAVFAFVPALFSDVDEHITVLLGDLHVVVVRLDGDEFAVLGVLQRGEKGAAIYAFHVGVIDGDFSVVQAVLVDGGKQIFLPFARGTYPQRSGLVVPTHAHDR